MGMPIGNLRPSTTIIYNNELYIVINCEHAKIARGSAFCRAKLKNLRTSQIAECTLRDSDNITQAFIDKRKLKFLYADGGLYHFLDMETYEDLTINESRIADKNIWLKDELELNGLFFENELVDLDLPLSLELKVIETEPGIKGDTAKMASKAAKLETGLKINVPLFVDKGDIIKVDTRTKEYLGRM